MCSVHSQNDRTKQLTDQRHSLHHHQPVNSRLHARNSFILTFQSLLCKPAVALVAKWQELWEQTDSNLKRYNIHLKERLPSGHTLPWRAWRTANRECSGQAATLAEKHLWGYRESKNCIHVQRTHMRSESNHDELHTFLWRKTERRRNCGNEG